MDGMGLIRLASKGKLFAPLSPSKHVPITIKTEPGTVRIKAEPGTEEPLLPIPVEPFIKQEPGIERCHQTDSLASLPQRQVFNNSANQNGFKRKVTIVDEDDDEPTNQRVSKRVVTIVDDEEEEPALTGAWNHSTSNMAQVMANIKAGLGRSASSRAPPHKRCRMATDHNSNYTTTRPIRSQRNEVYVGPFPHQVDPPFIAGYLRNNLRFDVRTEDVFCPPSARDYGFVRMGSAHDADSAERGTPYFYRFGGFSGKVFIRLCDRARRARGIRAPKSYSRFRKNY